MRIGDDPDLEGHRSARLLSRIESTIDFGHSHYRSAVKNVSKQILKDHLPLPVIEKVRGLCERLQCGLNDEPNGACAAACV